jgi:hypothetical protein
MNIIEMDEEDVAENKVRKFAVDRMDSFWKRGLRIVLQYPGNKLMALDALALAIGEPEMIEMSEKIFPGKTNNAVKVAIKHFGNPKKKAAVTKAVTIIQDALGIEPMPGQRSAAGRKKMTNARIDQLKAK